MNESIVYDFVGVEAFRRICLGEELLILTPPVFRQHADTLAQWKRDKGISTNVFEVNDGDSSGPDTAEEIVQFIGTRYQTCNVRPWYILLFGDVEHIPTYLTRKLTITRVTIQVSLLPSAC